MIKIKMEVFYRLWHDIQDLHADCAEEKA